MLSIAITCHLLDYNYSLFTLINYCAIVFSFALMFGNGWFTTCDDFYDASACWLSHMKPLTIDHYLGPQKGQPGNPDALLPIHESMAGILKKLFCVTRQFY